MHNTEGVAMSDPTDSNELPPERNPLRTILEQHGITDPSQFLINRKDVPIDPTPRIDGVPLISQEAAERRMRALRFL